MIAMRQDSRLLNLQEIAPFVKILGCYPVDELYDPANTRRLDPIKDLTLEQAAHNGSLPASSTLLQSNLPADSDSLLISAAANILPIQQVSSPLIQSVKA